MKKLFLPFIISLFILGGCSSREEYLNPNDYAQTVSFIADNFETENIAQSNSVPDYLELYRPQKLSEEVTLYTNPSNQVAYINFRGLNTEKTNTILNKVGLPIDEDLELLLNNPNEFEKVHEQRFLSYLLDDDTGIHILAFDDEFMEATGLNGDYMVHVFYNLNIYEDFLNQ